MSWLEAIFGEHGTVEEIEFDDDLLQHLARRGFFRKHQVSLAEIAEAHASRPKYFENTGAESRAPIIMVAPTNLGRLLCVPLEPTKRKGVWRPVTAFEANVHHRARYEGSS